MSDFFFPENECGIGNKVPKADLNFVVSCDILPPPPPVSECLTPVIVPDPIIPCPRFNVTAEISTTIDKCSAEEEEDPDKKQSNPDGTQNDGTDGGGTTTPPQTGEEPFSEADILAQWPLLTDTNLRRGRGSLTPLLTSAGFFSTEDSAWGLKNFPAQKSQSDTAGVKFMVDTEGVAEPFHVRFFQRATAAASRWAQIDYTLDGGNTWTLNFWNNSGQLTPPLLWHMFRVDFSSVEGAKNNPNFGFRVVSIFSPRAFDQNNASPPAAENTAYMRSDVGAVYAPNESSAAGDYLSLGEWHFKHVLVATGEPPGGDYAGPDVVGGTPDADFDNNPDYLITKDSVFANTTGTQQDKDKKEQEDCCEDTGIKFTITPKPRCAPEDSCEFDIELDINIKIPIPPCPEINTELEVEVVFDREDCVKRESRFEVRTRHEKPTCDDPGRCIFDIILDLLIPIPVIPCPIINVKTFEVGSGFLDQCSGQSQFTITTSHDDGDCKYPGQCVFDIELRIWVPIPPVQCPEINITNFSVTSSYEPCRRGKNRFQITSRKEPGSCQSAPRCVFDVELEIDIPIPVPPCPSIDGALTTRVRYSDMGGGGGSRLQITSNTQEGCGGPECSFFIDIFIDIPIPRVCCPVITADSQISVGYGFPTFATFIVQDFSNCFRGRAAPPVCRFNLSLQISVGLPLPPCPKFVNELELKVLNAGDEPYAYFIEPTVSPPRFALLNGIVVLEPCEIKIKLFLGIPKACKLEIIKGEDEFRKVGCDVEDSHVELMVEALEPCKYKVWLYGWLPPRCNKTVEGGSSSVEYCECNCGSGGSTSESSGTLALRAALVDDAYIATESGGSSGSGSSDSEASGCGSISIEVEDVAGEDGGAGGYKLIPKLKLPKTQCITGGEVNISPTGIGSGSITIQGPCDDAKIIVNIDLNVTDCPDSPGVTGPSGLPYTESFTAQSPLPMIDGPRPVPAATQTQIRQTILDGLKLNRDGSPADPEFYNRIADVIKTLIPTQP